MFNMSAFSPEQSRWLGLGDCGFEASSDPTHLPDPNFYFNAISWSTTDPTLLLTDQRHQQQQHNTGEMQFAMGFGGSGGNSKVSCDSIMGPGDDMGFEAGSCQSFPSNTAPAPAATMLAAERMKSHVDLESGRSIRSRHAVSSTSSSIDPFSFCDGGGGGDLNASLHSQWTYQHNKCSLPSDQLYYSCPDAWMLPKLVSDPFSDSCCSSDKGQSTSSEEITWMNTSRVTKNNSDLSAVPNLQQHRNWGGGGGLMSLSSSCPVVPADLVPDEYSSSIAAAANDEVELAAVATTTLEHVRQHPHHHGSTAVDVECGAPAPRGRASWMSPGVGSARKSPHGTMTTTTLDPLLQLQQMSDDLVPTLPQSVLGPFKPHQHRAHTLDGLHNVQRALPLSLQSPSQQTYSSNSSISARYNSGIYPIMPTLMNPGALMDNSTSSSNNVANSFRKSFHSFSTGRLPLQQGVVSATPSSTMAAAPAAGGMCAGFKEFNVGGGFESRRDYSSDQLTLLSTSKKPTATSVEPQSVAARHRRKKISERVRVLEKLVPGGNKMDTASMLDEAIEYVKFLQLQVQLLESMGEPEAPPNSSTTAAKIGLNNNSSCGQFYPNSSNKCKIDGSGLIDGGFGSSSHLSRSASLQQQVTLAAAAATAAVTNTPKSTATSPLILSEVLQEQLFKRKLCLVSLT